MKLPCLMFLAVILIFSGACSMYHGKPTKVILQNPETLEFVSCEVDEWETTRSFADNDKCIDAYKKKGFIVWGTR